MTDQSGTDLRRALFMYPIWCQENLVGLLEPINTRITDPQYFLDTPQQGRTGSAEPPPVPFVTCSP